MIHCLHTSATQYIDMDVLKLLEGNIDSFLQGAFDDYDDYSFTSNSDVSFLYYSDIHRATTFLSHFHDYDGFGNMKKSFTQQLKATIKNRIVMSVMVSYS